MASAKQNKIDRRNFLKAVGTAGLAATLAHAQTASQSEVKKQQKATLPQVPKRKLGKTGIEVPCLALGTIFDALENQTVLRNAVKWGVTYWDTAPDYAGPNSELGIGKFIADNPKIRKKLFISTKASDATSIADVEKALQTSLKRLNTDYIDLYHIMDRGVRPGFTGHGLSDPGQLTDELKQWVQSAKKRKLIRFFGFPTHKNIAQCLLAAAKLDWIDVIMPVYSFRSRLDDKMQAAVEACHKAGIGLIAMKIQGYPQELKTEQEKKLLGHFRKRGLTEVQAKIKVVLADERFSSACIRMENVAILTENISAVLDKSKLTEADMAVFDEYAKATCSSYCAGCAYICDSALPDVPYVSDIMRYLMYYNSYGDKARARQLFPQIPGSVRDKLLTID
ncbi:MAG: aldo/keto reductase, partial [Sedimentisphaerales bacterium]